MNTTQIIGIVIVVIGITTSFLVDNVIIGVALGVLSAVGIGLIFKWIPFRK